MKECIAERKLVFVQKGSAEGGELLIRIGRPYLVDPQKVNFRVSEDTAGCAVEFFGLEKEYIDQVYGADLLQALQLAADVEPKLKRLSEKYDLFFPTGEPYFGDEKPG